MLQVSAQRKLEEIVQSSRTTDQLREERNQLTNRLDALAEEHRNLCLSLVESPKSTPVTQIYNEHLAQLTERMELVRREIRQIDVQLSLVQTGQATTAVPPQGPQIPALPGEYITLYSIVSFVAILLPISIAFARRIWRRSTTPAVALPPEVIERMQRMEQAIEATAIEVERIGEGQRYVTQLLGEQVAALKESSARAPLSDGSKVRAVQREITPH